ncbi:MAG: hypothetical protein AAGD07_03765 [Planctomycetota bacterium]
MRLGSGLARPMVGGGLAARFMRTESRSPRIEDSATLLTASLVGLVAFASVGFADKPEPDASKSTIIQSTAVVEASGISFSHRDPTCVWVHNDSGDDAFVYAIDRATGESTARVQLVGLQAVDWEDMAIFSVDGQPKMLIADVGDNLSERESVTLHLFDEPDPHQDARIPVAAIKRINIRYPDGPRNCEAVWVDPRRKRIYLAEKATLPWAGVYSISWDAPEPASLAHATLRREASLAIPWITGADHDARTGDLWVISYWQAFRFRLQDSQPLESQLTVIPESIALPRLKQIEAVGVDAQSRMWVTSEGQQPPLMLVDSGALAAMPQTQKVEIDARN